MFTLSIWGEHGLTVASRHRVFQVINPAQSPDYALRCRQESVGSLDRGCVEVPTVPPRCWTSLRGADESIQPRVYIKTRRERKTIAFIHSICTPAPPNVPHLWTYSCRHVACWFMRIFVSATKYSVSFSVTRQKLADTVENVVEYGALWTNSNGCIHWHWQKWNQETEHVFRKALNND